MQSKFPSDQENREETLGVRIFSPEEAAQKPKPLAKRREPALIIIPVIIIIRAQLPACLPLDGQYKCQETKIIAAKMVVKGIF